MQHNGHPHGRHPGQQSHPSGPPTGAPPPQPQQQQHQQPMTAVQALAQANEQTWLLMGAVAEQLSDLDRAQAAYEHALRHNPASISALTQVAGIARAKDDFGKAIEFFQRVLNISQDNGEIWGALGHCYLMMDDLQKAYTAYQQALYHLPNPKEPKLWYGIGILYDRYGSLEHAEDAFSSVLRMDPNFEKANEIYFRLGIIYKQQHKYPASLDCFKYILKNPPRPLTDVDIWFQIGHVYEQQKEFIYAKEAYERVLSENPEHSKVLQQLGWLYHQRDATFTNQELAVSYLEKSLASDRSDAQTWYLLGRVFMSGQRYNKAYEYYQQAVYRDGRNPTFWCSIGVLYYQINQFRDALDAYSRAIRLNPYISEVWFDLGSLYESCNNQITDAIDAYGRALDLDPNNPTIKTRLSLLRNLQQNGGPPPIPPPPRDVHPTAYANSGPAGTLGPASTAIANGPQGRPGSANPMMAGPPQQQQQQQQQQQLSQQQQQQHALGLRPDQQGTIGPVGGSTYHSGGFPPGGPPGTQHPPSRMPSPVAPLGHGRPDERSSRHGPTPMDVDRPQVVSTQQQQQQQAASYGQQRAPSSGRPLFDARNGGLSAESPRMRGAPGGGGSYPPPPPQAAHQPYTNPYPPYTSAPPGVHHPGAGERPGMSGAEAEWERAREKGASAFGQQQPGYYPPAGSRSVPQDLRRASISDDRNGDLVARRGSLGRSPFHPMSQQQQQQQQQPSQQQAPPSHGYYGHGQDRAKSPGMTSGAPPSQQAPLPRRYDPTQDEAQYRAGVDQHLPGGSRLGLDDDLAAGGSKQRRKRTTTGEEKDKKPRKSRTSGPDGSERDSKRRSRKTQESSLKGTPSSSAKSSKTNGPADGWSSAPTGRNAASPSRSDDSSIRGATPAAIPVAAPAVPSRFVDDNYDDDEETLSDTGGAADLLMGLAGGFSFSNSRGAPPTTAPALVSTPAPARETASTAPPLFPSPAPQAATSTAAATSVARSPIVPYASTSTAAISTLSVPASDERTTREDSIPIRAATPSAAAALVPPAGNPLKRDFEGVTADGEATKRPKIEEAPPPIEIGRQESAEPATVQTNGSDQVRTSVPSSPTATHPAEGAPAPSAAGAAPSPSPSAVPPPAA